MPATHDEETTLGRLGGVEGRLGAATSIDDLVRRAAAEILAVTGSTHAWGCAATDAGLGPWSPFGEGAPAPPAAATSVTAVRGLADHAAFLFPGPDSPRVVVLLPGAVDASRATAAAEVALVAGLSVALFVSRERLAAVTRARELLLGSVSHDLRNPLNTFAMSAGLLRDDIEREDVDPTRALNLVGRMDRASARIQAILEDLLLASQIDAGKIEYAVRPESAGDLLRAAAGAAPPRNGEKTVPIVCGAIDDDLRIDVDRARTLQLLTKLAAYAAKATGESGTLRVDAARDGAVARVTAHALGPDGAAVRAPEEGRGGLALMMARGLAEAQRGSLGVASRGDGAASDLVVVLTLPVATS